MRSGKFYHRVRVGIWLCVLVIWSGVEVWAHETKGFETANFVVHEKSLVCTFRGPDVDFLPACGVNAVEMRGEDTAEDAKTKFGAWIDSMLSLKADSADCRAEVESLSVIAGKSGNFVEVELKYPTQTAAKVLTIFTSFSPQIVVSFGGTPIPIKADQSQNVETGKSASVWKNSVEFFKMGMEHLFLGIDHILFISTLIFASLRFGNVIKLLTAFTIGHAITLILTALNWFSVNPKWVECGIAATIAYVGIENLFANGKELRWRPLLVFGFGLIHGMGFSENLREFGLPQNGLVLCLLSFNLGIEAAQVLIVSAIYPLLLGIKHLLEKCGRMSEEPQHATRRAARFQMLLNIGSSVTAVMGSYWFFQRLMG